MLDGLGLVTDVERLPLVVERNGRVDTVVVAPTGRFAVAHGHGPGPIDMRGWVSMRDSAPPLWEQRAEQPFWWAYLLESRTVYVSARAVVPAPHSNTNRGEWDQIFALVDTAPFARLVLDLRENLGGNGGLNRYPVQQILRRLALDQPDRLFVIIGRRTFSAGDTAGAERALREGQGAVRNRFRNLEGDINALGYRLLGAGAVDRAIVVLAVNTRVYPGSANTFDSLGEALLAGGRRDEAIAAYRHAVALDPEFRSSIEALRRLGVR